MFMQAAAHPPLLFAHSSTSAQVMPLPVKPDLHRQIATLVVAHVAFGSHFRSHVIGGAISIGASAGGSPSISAGSGRALKPHAASQSTINAKRPLMGRDHINAEADLPRIPVWELRDLIGL
ncbi:MAG TPA: hypothetical protein VF469_05765 [Kofleriaceae bacterium]